MSKYYDYFYKNGIRKILGFPYDCYASQARGVVSAYYFDGVLNVGDLLTPYIINKKFGFKVVLTRTSRMDHLLAVGSVLHKANNKSKIWGSGFLSEKHLPKKIDVSNVYAVRGELSKEVLVGSFGLIDTQLSLGDPGVIMPMIYPGKKINKKYRIGVIPHYVDAPKVLAWKNKLNIPEAKVINVKQHPEPFIDEICQCEFIFSSSLHGLILADAYGVSNKWVRFSDKVIGGNFKFSDYYSTTNSPSEKPLYVDIDEFEDICLGKLNGFTKAKSYEKDKIKLIQSFPINTNS